MDKNIQAEVKYYIQLSLDGQYWDNLIRDRYLDTDGNVKYKTYTKKEADLELQKLNAMKDDTNNRERKYYENTIKPLPMLKITYKFRKIPVQEAEAGKEEEFKVEKITVGVNYPALKHRGLSLEDSHEANNPKQ